MQDEFNAICEWCHDNSLVINAAKTKEMHIRTPSKSIEAFQVFHRNDRCPPSTNKKAIELVRTFKYLGVTIDEHFPWREHINVLRLQLKSNIFEMMYL